MSKNAVKIPREKRCDDCPGTYTITFDADNMRKILRIQGEYLLQGKRRGIENIVNQLVKNCDR